MLGCGVIACALRCVAAAMRRINVDNVVVYSTILVLVNTTAIIECTERRHQPPMAPIPTHIAPIKRENFNICCREQLCVGLCAYDRVFDLQLRFLYKCNFKIVPVKLEIYVYSINKNKNNIINTFKKN